MQQNHALSAELEDIGQNVPLDDRTGLVKRDELARQLVTMYGHSAANLARAEVKEFDRLFMELSDAISVPTRIYMANSFADLTNAPHDISLRLADDDIEIARPILLRSVVLTDDDLIIICDRRGASHMVEIAQRDQLSVLLTDALVFRGDDLVRQHVARNSGASISPRGFSRLAGQARTDRLLEQILVARPDLPGVAVHILVKFGSKQVREQLEPANGQKPNNTPAVSPSGRAREFDTLDFAAARAHVDLLAQQGTYGESLLMRFVAEEKLAESMIVLSRIVGVTIADVKSWYTEATPETLLVAARAYGIDSRTIFGLLGLGRWRLTLDPRSRQTAIVRYQTMTKAHAVKLLGTWRKNRHAVMH